MAQTMCLEAGLVWDSVMVCVSACDSLLKLSDFLDVWCNGGRGEWISTGSEAR